MEAKQTFPEATEPIAKNSAAFLMFFERGTLQVR